MLKTYDTVRAHELEDGDTIDYAGVYTIKSRQDDGELIYVVVLDEYDDEQTLILSADEDINLVMESDED